MGKDTAIWTNWQTIEWEIVSMNFTTGRRLISNIYNKIRHQKPK